MKKFLRPEGIIAAIVLLTWGVQQARVVRAERRLRVAEASLDSATFERMNDSARAAKTVIVLRDSLRFASRPVVQAKVDTAAVLAKLGLSIEPLDTTLIAVSDTSVRQWSFEVRQGPFSGNAKVAVSPYNPHEAAMRLSLSIEKAALGVRIRCGPAQTRGLRGAEVQVVGPMWLQTEVVGVQQDPMVCNAPVLMARATAGHRPFPRWLVPVATAATGYLAERIAAPGKNGLTGAALGGILGVSFTLTVR